MQKARPMNLDRLFEPVSIGGLSLANRLVMAPMTRHFSPGGVPSREVAGYYARRARNDVGLIITEGVAVDHAAAVDYDDVPDLHNPAALSAWRGVVDEVHAAGGKIIPQLWHQGPLRNAAISNSPSLFGVRPSGIWGPEDGTVSLDPDLVRRQLVPSRPATDSEIQDIIDSFARSARNAIGVGFDGIALHGAHGYLIDCFLWKETNKRRDRWGGVSAARAEFAAAVVRAIRAEIGADRPIIFRFSQFKMQDYRAVLAETPMELEALLGPIAQAGVDVFDGSQRFFDQPTFECMSLNLAGWAKRLTGKASMTVGGVGVSRPHGDTRKERSLVSRDNLDRLMPRLDRGEFDLVGVGRALANDPEWARKIRCGESPTDFDQANMQILT